MKKLLLLFFVALACLSIVYAAPTCTMNTLYQYPSSVSALNVTPSISCLADKNITRTNVTCDGVVIYNTTNLNRTTYVFNSTVSLLGNQTRICSIYLNSTNGSYSNNFVLQYMFTTYSPTFATNSCPTETSQVILYLGLLFFFLAVIVICLMQRQGLIGIFASIAIMLYSLFVTGCYPVFGMLFLGIGIGFFMYFFFGRY